MKCYYRKFATAPKLVATDPDTLDSTPLLDHKHDIIGPIAVYKSADRKLMFVIAPTAARTLFEISYYRTFYSYNNMVEVLDKYLTEELKLPEENILSWRSTYVCILHKTQG